LGLTVEPLEDRELLAVDVTPVYAVTNSWTSGYQAAIVLESHQSANITPWQLEFDLSANITSIWNATIASHSGNHYVIAPAVWNTTLVGNGKVDFGFVADGAVVSPSNYKVNGDGGPIAPPPAPLPTVSITSPSIVEGASGTKNLVFTVSLSAAPTTTAVLVPFATADGTATAATDYRATSGTLPFARGQTKRYVTVPVNGDTTVEADENFFVNLSNPSGATLAQSRGTATITNDDLPTTPPPSSGNVQFTVTSDWGTGYTAQVTLRNTSNAPLDNWQLEFDYAGQITSIWDAAVTSHVGNHYVIANAGYNATIAAGGTVAFGLNGSPGGVATGPTNYLLRSVGGGTPTPGNQAPVANEDFVYTAPGQAVTIGVAANDVDPENDALTVTAITSAAHGTVVLNADSTVRYTPTAGYTGGDTFNYTLRDARGATATGKVTLTVAAQSAWPARVYAPYVDMTLYPMYDLVAAARTQNIRHFSLAFIVADPQNKPAWGGYAEYGLGTTFDAQMKSQISGVRALGGDVIVSFGGAANHEIAEQITNVTALQRAYQSVIDAYGLTHIDFDIEGAAQANRASVDRRNQAIAGLQRDAATAGRVLDVSYTLPVLPTGLTADGLYILQSAARYGVNVNVVNIMAMDYGDSAAPNPVGKMGDYAIAAATSLFNQLKSLYGTAKNDAQLWQMVGVTPMIGLNDVTTETFDQQEARELEAFALQKGIGRIAMWSLNRDKQNASGKITYVDNTSSSLVQQPFEFSKIFLAYEGG